MGECVGTMGFLAAVDVECGPRVRLNWGYAAAGMLAVVSIAAAAALSGQLALLAALPFTLPVFARAHRLEHAAGRDTVLVTVAVRDGVIGVSVPESRLEGRTRVGRELEFERGCCAAGFNDAGALRFCGRTLSGAADEVVLYVAPDARRGVESFLESSGVSLVPWR